MLALTALCGCAGSGAYSTPGPTADPREVLYPKETADCSKWTDASRYDADGVSFYAVSRDVRSNPPTLVLQVMVPERRSVTFEQTAFYILDDAGKSYPGHVVSISQQSAAGYASDPLPTEALSLHAKASQTLYRITLGFDDVLPPRFDLHIPDVRLGGKRYSVRTYSFRYSNDRQQLGLCL